MTRADLEEWLAAYGRAWETADPYAAASLFADDATYRETPFDEVMTGPDAIRAYWQREVVDAQEGISFGWDVVHAETEPAVVRWRASYVRSRDGQPFTLDGVFLLEFGDGLCRSLLEWWHADRPF